MKVPMKAAIYPGTFDPPTLGHLDLVRRAAALFDRLIIAVGINPSKGAASFSATERVALLKTVTAAIPNIEITTFDGLLVDFAQAQGISIIVRAIRTIFDFEHETLQAQMNRQLGHVETLYLTVNEKYRLISSTLVREIASHGRRLHDFVPLEIEPQVFERYQKSAY
jgi:pantetheine-phosphate adenylyltransferase